MWTTDNNHGAQLQFHTGRHVLEGQFPTIGSWVHYGLGSLNDNLPQLRRAGHADRRLLRRHRRARGQLPRSRAQRRAVGHRPQEPPALRRAGQRRLSRGAAGRVRAAGPAEPLVGGRVSGRRGAAGPDQVLRAGLPHADGRARGRGLRGRDRRHAARCTAWTRSRPRPLAASAWSRDDWSSKACGSCRSSTAVNGGAGAGTLTAG